jgi:2-haloalkanoic acid dehalogenase type II
VREAALECGLSEGCAERLVGEWDSLQPWSDAAEFLAALGVRRLGVVTNCSEALGRRAASRLGVPFAVVVTSERAGYYKPHPAPYRLALQELNLAAERVLFVCGSGFDLFGTASVGLATLWHNRAGLAKPQGAPAPAAERRTLRELLPLIE